LLRKVSAVVLPAGSSTLILGRVAIDQYSRTDTRACPALGFGRYFEGLFASFTASKVLTVTVDFTLDRLEGLLAIATATKLRGSCLRGCAESTGAIPGTGLCSPLEALTADWAESASRASAVGTASRTEQLGGLIVGTNGEITTAVLTASVVDLRTASLSSSIGSEAVAADLAGALFGMVSIRLFHDIYPTNPKLREALL